VPFDVAGCRDYLSKDREVLKLLGAEGVRIEQVESCQDLFKAVGQEALVFKYTGADVDFWIELVADGQTKIRQHIVVPTIPDELSELFAAPDSNQVAEGYFVWVRGKADDSGKEDWRLGSLRSVAAAESASRDLPSSLAQGQVSESKQQRQAITTFWGPTGLQVWKGKKSSAWRIPKVRTTIPAPVPTDREVCLKTITEQNGSKGQEGFEEHVIRVMCKVVPFQKNAKKGQSPAN
jgi:hypothetical protein